MSESGGVATRVEARELVRPIYMDLQGQLFQIPPPESASHSLFTPEVWEHYHTTIEELQGVTGKDYNHFRVKPVTQPGGAFRGGSVSHTALRQKMGGLVNRLYTEYFSGDEPPPFSGVPGTAITLTQNQAQAQSLHVQMILEFRDKIDEKIREHERGTKERNFLEKLKTGLHTVSGYAHFLKLAADTAKEFGILVGDIAKILT